MATLSPNAASTTRARSSSTAGNLTTARSRTTQQDQQDPFLNLPSDQPLQQQSQSPQQIRDGQGSPGPLLPPSQQQPRSMFNVIYTMASRVIPIHDALTSSLPPPTSGKGKSDLDLDLALNVLGKRDDAWDGEKAAQFVGDSTAASGDVRGKGGCTRPTSIAPAKKAHKSHKRNPSPFSSLFISPPSHTLPPPVSSPRTSGSFSRFSTLSIHIPIPSAPHPASSSSVPPTKLILPLLTVCSLFFITFLPVLYGISSLPIYSLKSLPKTINDIKAVAKDLDAYASSGFGGMAHIFAVLAVTSVWKNAWSVPGSALLNVLAGALMNPIIAALLQTALTTVGSICSTLLSKPLAPIISHVFPRALSLTRTAFEGSPFSSPEMTPVDVEETEKLLDPSGAVLHAPKKTPIWVRLTVLRLVGVVPWSALNLACGVCNVPVWDCAVGSFVGVLPWTAVTCQIGDILQTVASTSSSASDAPAETLSSLLSSPSIIVKLVFLSLLSLGPVLMRDRLSNLISRSRRRSSRLRNDELNEKVAPS